MSDQIERTEFESLPHNITAALVHERAARYTKQLISHWRGGADRIDTDEGTTTMFFLPEDEEKVSVLRFVEKDDRVEITLATNTEVHASFLVDAVNDHLIRFAGKRDTLEIVWDTPE